MDSASRARWRYLRLPASPFVSFRRNRGLSLIDPVIVLMKIVVLPERVAAARQRIDRRFAGMLEEWCSSRRWQCLLSLDLKPEMPAMKAIGVPQIAALLCQAR